MTAGQNREADLVSALGALRSRLAHAAEAAGRNTADIELLPITKFFPAGDVAILWRLGCRSFGESRDQEATAKIAEFGRLTGADRGSVHWHMVGQIQSKKAKHVAQWADTVHSVATAKVAAALTAVRCRHSPRAGAPRRCGFSYRSAWTVTPNAAGGHR